MKKNPQYKPSEKPSRSKRQQPERIQKLLAQAGVGSRRQVEKWIAEGTIHVNGEVAKLGDKITTQDIVNETLKVDRVFLSVYQGLKSAVGLPSVAWI